MDTKVEDIVVENQRGFTILGYPIFSSKLLIPRVDPPQFEIWSQENKHTEIGLGTEFYPLDLETDTKKYKWFVAMEHRGQYDIDDQGWSYSWHFGSKRWKGKNGFVRKRVWVRLPVINNPSTDCKAHSQQEISLRLHEQTKSIVDLLRETSKSSTETAYTAAKEDGTETPMLVQKLQPLQLDRQRLEVIREYIRSTDSELVQSQFAQDSPFLNQLLRTFQFDETRREFVNIWLPTELGSVRQTGTMI